MLEFLTFITFYYPIIITFYSVKYTQWIIRGLLLTKIIRSILGMPTLWYLLLISIYYLLQWKQRQK